MAVPTPPTAGEPIAEAWGDVVHDTAVAVDIQSGTVMGSAGAAAANIGVAVVFPRPFASKPNVALGNLGTAGGAAGGDAWIVNCYGVSPTGFNMRAQHRTGTGTVTDLVMGWIAIGPRA